MKRLYINPITRTIEPKYRSQKAVYISKGDHNSTLLRFEIPKMVDGFDISEATIQIHYANISSDGLNTSKGMTNAKEVNKEDSTLTFAWEIPKTATRYAGVLSIGITFERYEGIDGKSEEIYSWSTAPYGEIVVCDSYDNSAEVTEHEHDYLVETCNAIVLASLEGNLKSIYEQALNKATGEATTQAEGHRAWAKTYADESANSALLSESYAVNALHYCEQAEKYSETASTSATNAQTAESKAKGYSDEALRIKGKVDDLKNAVETAKNAVETAKNAVETAKSEVEAARNEVGENTMYSQTYKNATESFKNEAESFKNEAEGFMIQASEHSGNAWNYANECEAVYNKLLKALESKVSGKGVVRLEDVNMGINTAKVECSSPVTMYGKNLTDFKGDWDGKTTINSSDRPYKEIGVPCTVMLSVEREGNEGTVFVYKSKDKFGSYTKIVQVNTGDAFKPYSITPENEYRYYIVTAPTSAKYFKRIQTEVGGVATEYEAYKPPVALTDLDNVELYSPTATLIAESPDAPITATYTKDINRTIERLENAIANS